MSEPLRTENGLTDITSNDTRIDRNPAAVLWDMDGTLIDTEPLWHRAEAEIAHEHEADWSTADALASTGQSIQKCAARLQERGVAGQIDQIVLDLSTRVEASVRRGDAQWMPGALDVLRLLSREGIPVALVTNSFRALASTVSEKVPDRPFRVIVAWDDVSVGKPDPASYLKAAANLAVDPSECVAIEDTETGAIAAAAAGLRVIVAPGVQPVPPAEHRSRIRSLVDVDITLLRSVTGGAVVDHLDPVPSAGEANN